MNAASSSNLTYDSKCDIYSAGVIFYLLYVLIINNRLTGVSPFDGSSFDEILNKNKRAEIDFNHEGLKKISPVAIDLLKNMLIVDPKIRFTAKQCLNHAFFGNEDHNVTLDGDTDESISQHLKNFQQQYSYP